MVKKQFWDKKNGKNPKKDHKKAFEELLKDLSGSDVNFMKVRSETCCFEIKTDDGLR